MIVDLIRYRDAGMHTYTYFWIDERKRTVSPFFDTDKEAFDWIENENRNNGTERKTIRNTVD